MRKTRLWICDKCRNVYSRKKAETGRTHSTCGRPMRRARSFPSASWYERRKKRQEHIERKKRSETVKWSKPRDSHGRRLHLSTEAKALWRKIGKARSIQTIKHWAQPFVNSVHASIHRLGISGFVNPPTVVWSDQRDSYIHGEYKRSIFEGRYDITIFKGWKIEQMKETIIHEMLHHVDSEANVPKTLGSHDCTWRARLIQFKKDLGKWGKRFIDEEGT